MIALATGENSLLAIIRLCRLEQWWKNVFAVSGFAFVAYRLDVLDVAYTFMLVIAFCAAASSVYIVNDALDIEADRQHPIKRSRPFAAGTITLHQGYIAVAALSAGALGIAALINWRTLVILIGYLTVSHVYSLWLKHLPYLELATVGLLFGLRVSASFTAVSYTSYVVMVWIVLAGLLATIIVCSKRWTELRHVGAAAKTRKVLHYYTLRRLQGFSVGLSILIVPLYGVAAWQMHPVFLATTVLVLIALVKFHHGVRQLTEDVHPLKVVKCDPLIWGCAVCFGVLCLLVNL